MYEYAKEAKTKWAMAGLGKAIGTAAELPQVGAVDSRVQVLQQAILVAGCPLPRYGADGKWGAETKAGVECLSERYPGGMASITGKFPWITTLMARRIPTPTPTPAVTPIITPTPTPGAAPAALPDISPLPAAPIYDQWWFLPVVGVTIGVVGLVGYMQYKKGQEAELEEAFATI
jgi:hypothetical protein